MIGNTVEFGTSTHTFARSRFVDEIHHFDTSLLNEVVAIASESRERARLGSGSGVGLEHYSTQEMHRELIRRLDNDPDRDGLERTPERVEKAMRFLTQGYDQDPAAILRGAMFDVAYNEMVLVRDIEMFSLCEHHMLPFFGKVHVGYIPNGKVVGLSKIPRLVDVFSRRLQVQERLTQQIAEAIQDAIQPEGVAVVVDAQHMCMMMRGVEKQRSTTLTSAMVGVFREPSRRAEFMAQLGGH